MEKLIVTGSCGFIGMHLCESLLKDGFDIYGIDVMNSYYDIQLKNDRLARLLKYENFTFNSFDIADLVSLEKVFKNFKPQKVVNLAAQAGVRYSLENPHEYIKSNVVGFMNILDCCKKYKIEGLIYASSSSVYGANTEVPFSTNDRVNNQISIYAVTKRSNELMANSYSHLYGLNTTGLRFFTVYGPWGRPDMAMYIFANNVQKSIPLPVFNYGKMKRDFTYIDDIVLGVRASIEKNYRSEIFNLGNNRPENLMDVVSLIENFMNKKAKVNFLKMQPGDVKETYADISLAYDKLKFKPEIKLEKGVKKFLKWFKEYHKNKR